MEQERVWPLRVIKRVARFPIRHDVEIARLFASRVRSRVAYGLEASRSEKVRKRTRTQRKRSNDSLREPRCERMAADPYAFFADFDLLPSRFLDPRFSSQPTAKLLYLSTPLESHHIMASRTSEKRASRAR